MDRRKKMYTRLRREGVRMRGFEINEVENLRRSFESSGSRVGIVLTVRRKTMGLTDFFGGGIRDDIVEIRKEKVSDGRKG